MAKGTFTTTTLKNTPSQTIDIYAPTPAYFNQSHVADKPLNQFDVWYVESHNSGTPVTKEAHNYDELYRYDGQIYEFLVHNVLNYNGHKVLAQTAMDLAEKQGLNKADTVIVDMGAGHGPMLQVLREKGFKGNLIGLEISEAAKKAHDTSHSYPYLKYRYDDYWLGRLSSQPHLLQQLKQKSPAIFVAASISPLNEAMDDIHEALKIMKPKCYFIINMAFNESSDKMYAYISNLEQQGYLSIEKKQNYQHRSHLNGAPLFFDCFTYKILKPIT